MLIGTRMWYGFFGEVLADDSLFEGKVSELCRDIGDRSKKPLEEQEPATLATGQSMCVAEKQLTGLSNKQLRARAKELGATAEQLETAADADNMRAALVSLSLALDSTTDAGEELGALSNKELRARAKQAGATAEQLEAAVDADDMREALLALLAL